MSTAPGTEDAMGQIHSTTQLCTSSLMHGDWRGILGIQFNAAYISACMHARTHPCVRACAHLCVHLWARVLAHVWLMYVTGQPHLCIAVPWLARSALAPALSPHRPQRPKRPWCSGGCVTHSLSSRMHLDVKWSM